MTHAIRVQSLNKTFGARQVLHGLELDVPVGAMVALIGASGSGKSTLLRHLAGLATGDRNSGGEVQMLGQDVQKNGVLNRNVRRLRSDIGYIFQQFNLVGRLSVLKDIADIRAQATHIPIEHAVLLYVLPQHLYLATAVAITRCQTRQMAQQGRFA